MENNEEKAVETVLHQTLCFRLDDMSAGIKYDENNEMDYVPTQFDTALDDFIANIGVSDEYEVIGSPMIVVNSGYIIAIITYATKVYIEEMKRAMEAEMNRRNLAQLR